MRNMIIESPGEITVQREDKGVNLVLIADDPGRAALLKDTMERAGIDGVIRRLAPGAPAIQCARKSGAYRNKDLPDLILFDFADPNEENTSVLRDIAFSEERARVPVILLTSPRSQDLLDAGQVDSKNAIMFSATSLSSFIGKMRNGRRSLFFKALGTLYQYGPILVRLPRPADWRDHDLAALSA